MPGKPTKPFGYLSFPKKGKVSERITRLPDDKEGQEIEIAQKFVTYLGEGGINRKIEKLPENDNDFLLRSESGETNIVLELAELVGREYLVEATEEYKNSLNPRFTSWLYLDENEIYGVDEVAKTNTISNLIEHKLAKHYAKPTDAEFWLLLWTVQSDHDFEWWQKREKHVASSVIQARNYLRQYGSHPFDQIWAFYPDINPCKIWPLIDC